MFVGRSTWHQHVTKDRRKTVGVEAGIPNTYRFVWSGRSFPKLYALAIDSVLVADPAARVVIHCFGEAPASAHFLRATCDPRVTVERVEPTEIFNALPAHLRRVADIYESLPTSAASAQSNLLRYALLYLHGGVYLDFDTVTVRPLNNLTDGACFIGAERVWSLDERRVAGEFRVVRSPAGLCWLVIWVLKWLDAALFDGRLRLASRTRRLNARFTKLQANNAVIGAAPQAEFLDRLLRSAHSADPKIRYSTGPTLIDRVARTSPHLVDVLPPEYFYGVEPAESFRFFLDHTLKLHPDAALIHYVGSNSSRFLNKRKIPARSLIAQLAASVGPAGLSRDAARTSAADLRVANETALQ